MRVDIGTTDQFAEGKPHAVRVGERDLVIVRKGEAFFAVRDKCPHQGARLSRGTLVGEVAVGARGEQPELVREGEFLSCPWHGWKMDIRTGCSSIPAERARVRTYPVSISDGHVFVDMSPS